jgi:hypothetical protein
VESKLTEVVENNRTKAGDQADGHEIKRPFAGMGQIEGPVFAGQPVDPQCYGRTLLHAIKANRQYPMTNNRCPSADRKLIMGNRVLIIGYSIMANQSSCRHRFDSG